MAGFCIGSMFFFFFFFFFLCVFFSKSHTWPYAVLPRQRVERSLVQGPCPYFVSSDKVEIPVGNSGPGEIPMHQAQPAAALLDDMEVMMLCASRHSETPGRSMIMDSTETFSDRDRLPSRDKSTGRECHDSNFDC